jgi:hypothetical protein
MKAGADHDRAGTQARKSRAACSAQTPAKALSIVSHSSFAFFASLPSSLVGDRRRTWPAPGASGEGSLLRRSPRKTRASVP